MDKMGSNLDIYREKRDFTKTKEPEGISEKGHDNRFVIHKHQSKKLHYDLRLERDGVLKSWALPKGPPAKPGEKRLAIMTEDHPLEYRTFEGTIPPGEYGAGTVAIWDKGIYETLKWGSDKIECRFKGEQIEGKYVLLKFLKAGEKDWLFFKTKD